jgi:hypothetical protein
MSMISITERDRLLTANDSLERKQMLGFMNVYNKMERPSYLVLISFRGFIGQQYDYLVKLHGIMISHFTPRLMAAKNENNQRNYGTT